MAGRLQNLSNLFADMKTRTIILVTGGVLLLAIVVGVVGLHRSRTAATSKATIQTAPQNIQSVPGISPTSPEYAELQKQLNLKRRQQAQRTSKSFVPTVVSQTKGGTAGAGLLGGGGNNGAGAGLGGAGAGRGGAGSAAGAGGLAGSGAGAGGMSASDAAALKSQLAALQDQMNYQQSQLQQLNQQQLQTATKKAQSDMTNMAKTLMASWSGKGTPAQALVQGTAAQVLEKERQQRVANQAALASQPGPPIIKAGTILFGSLVTSVSSDEPGPVLANIVTGEFKGAKLIGSLQQTQDQSGLDRPEKVQMNFSTMNLPDKARTIGINAVAIDPDTARTALASHVDHHYLLRYGSLFASSFMEGYGSAVTQSGQIVSNLSTGSQITVSQELNPTEQIAAGFGQVGQRWGEQMDKIFDRPNTIIVNAGTSVGILFLTDVTINVPSLVPRLPQQTSATTQQLATANRSSQ